MLRRSFASSVLGSQGGVADPVAGEGLPRLNLTIEIRETQLSADFRLSASPRDACQTCCGHEALIVLENRRQSNFIFWKILGRTNKVNVAVVLP